jgi:hypothetical protein
MNLNGRISVKLSEQPANRRCPEAVAMASPLNIRIMTLMSIVEENVCNLLTASGLKKQRHGQ